MDISQAKAVISGGASGLGLATATRIINEGGSVALLDINNDQGESVAAELGERAIFLKTDVSDETNVTASIAAAAEFMGGVSLAVNCAGVLMPGRALGKHGPMPAENFARAVQVNLVGSFVVAKEAAAVMQNNEPNQEDERGVIVSTASVAAYEGQIGQAAYASSKAGVVGMTLPLAREFARIGIRVNAIAPGIFLTPMIASLSEDIQKSLGAQIPFPSRLGKPEEFADLVACIYGNPMINGETVRLDGAIRMQPK
jgi:NAD(P)-dependent dehydrogenase (short-subunit alcohol dehydrogenase family)